MPATLELDLATLSPPGNPDDFVVMERPVWKEHTMREVRDEETDELITPAMYMGREELEQVAQNCNERILDTGDFAVLCIRHTSEAGDRDPEVVGFAGPFRVAKFGNRKPKWHIFAKWWVYKSDVEKLKKYPRCSVEYWSSESDPTNGYFDPISLLGAETPELDLGVQYSRDESSGRRLLRYSRVTRFAAEAAPGGSNTFVPGSVEVDEKRKRTYQLENPAMPLSPEDISQLVDAFIPVIRATVQEEMAALKPAGDPVTDPAAMPADPSAATPGADGQPPSVGDGANPPEPQDAVPADGMGGDAGDDSDLDDDLGDDDDDENEDDKKDKSKQYSADTQRDLASDSLDAPEAAAEGLKEGLTKRQKYQRRIDHWRHKYEKEVAERRDLQTKYQKLQGEVDRIRAGEWEAKVRADLLHLQGTGVALDLDEEVADCLPLRSQPQRYQRHLDKIARHYSRAPIGRGLPQDAPEQQQVAMDRMRREQYSKQAAENVQAARKEGRKLRYEDELNRLLAEASAEPVKA